MASQAQAFEEKLTSLSAVLQKHVTVDKVRQATAVLLAYIQGSRDKVIREDGELIPGEALTRMKGAAMRLTGMLYRNPDLAEREELIQGELPFSVSVLIYDLRCPTVL
ncbi:head-tail connector protein [Escherichia coli]|uniref:head-tail connector protein n=1 Tax=Escherichia coli TaxID=562 RepID=UPI003F66D25C